RRDSRGFYYFVDRVGDTFRWKGENVSTAQIADALGTCPGVREAVVYGVAVPGTDGRAGMAALGTGPDFNLDNLPQQLTARLPRFAWPIFLRLCNSLMVTTTFKHKKQDLAADGFDPDRTADPLFVYDSTTDAFVRLDAVRHHAIVTGKTRL